MREFDCDQMNRTGVGGYPPGVGVVVEGRDGMDDGMDGVVMVGMDGVGMVLHVT